MTELDWRPRAESLADSLRATGRLTDPQWHQAFAETPRHLFVPYFYAGDDMRRVDEASGGEWLDAIYSDDSLVTQYAPAPGSDGLLWPTSSSTLPSLMARMLELLAVTDDSRVLEIGTGTGYNAALLSHRLGADNVATIDIDPELVTAAEKRLSGLGYYPRLRIGDGADGFPGSRFDRIIATCAISRIPTAWLTQLAAGGRIVADLRGEVAGSLIVLHKSETGEAHGRFLGTPGHFMWLRAAANNPLRDAGTMEIILDHSDKRRRDTTLDPALLDNPDFQFFLQLHRPDLRSAWTKTNRDGHETLSMNTTDDAWCEIATTVANGAYAVTYSHDSDLWASVEDIAATWEQHQRPSQTQLGITVGDDGSHGLWIEDPKTVIGPLP